MAESGKRGGGIGCGARAGASRSHPASPCPRAAIAARLLGAAIAALLLGAPGALVGQEDGGESRRSAAEGVRWFPDTTAFAPLLADPRDTGIRGALVLADRPDLDDLPEDAAPADFEGRNIEAEVALGLRLPVARLREETADGPSVVLSFETGIFTRFFMETSEKDLINADFRVGAPLSVGYRGWEGRLELRHLSSHFGDDFVRRFDAPFRQVSLEGFELLLARRLGPGIRLYAGGEANFQVSRDSGLERTAARWGIEYDPGARDGSLRVYPFAAADFRLDSATDEVAGTGVAGVGFRVGGTGFRVEARGHSGPSPMGQLREVDETFWGLGLRIEP